MSESFEKTVLEKLNRMENKLDNLKLNQSKTNTKLNNLILETKDIQDVVEYNTSRIIGLEHIFKDKIDALFDAHSVNDNKHKEFSKSIKYLQDETYNHDIRISILEDNLVNIKEG